MMANSNSDCFVIVIGETGSGKSTFINYVANALYKKSSLDALEVIIPNEYYLSCTQTTSKHSERALDDSTLSKTTECQHYTFPALTGRGSLVFIDTPGLGDTSGHLKDNQNVTMIFETIKSLDYISAIILIINGTTSRITSNVSNVLTRFRQFFPDSIYTNMIVVLTNCEQYNVSFDRSSLNLPSTCRFFCMQNSAYCKPLNEINAHRTSFEQEFEESINTTREIIKHLQKLQPQSTKAFADLNDERYRLQAFLHEAYLMILEMEGLENELESLKKMADFGRMNLEKLLQKSKISVLRATSANSNNIICTQCNKVCYRNCKLNEISLEDKNPISTGSKVRNGYCIQCSCPIKLHYFNSKDLKRVNRSIWDSIMRARQRLIDEQEDHELTVRRLNSMETIKMEVQMLLDRQCNRIRQHCMSLKQSCQNINIAQELSNFVQMLNHVQRQFQAPLVLTRLNNLVHALELIVSDCQRTGEDNSDNNLRCNPQVQNSTEAPPPVPLRQTSRQNTLVNTPSYYQPDSELELNSPSKPIHKLPTQSQRYSAYSTERLIGAHHELMRMNSEYSKQTLFELQQRVKGNSVGLLNRYELAQFANHYADCRHHDEMFLQEEYENLAKKIDAGIDHDASNLDYVEADDLLRIAALSLLINPVTQV